MNKILLNLTAQIQIKNSWKRTSQSTHQLCGGISIDCGQYILSECIEIRGQPTLMLWCDDFETKFVTQILTRLCDFVTTFQQRWMRSIASRERKFHPTLTLESLHLRATAIFAPPNKLASSPSKITLKQTKKSPCSCSSVVRALVINQRSGVRLPEGTFFDTDDYENADTFM